MTLPLSSEVSNLEMYVPISALPPRRGGHSSNSSAQREHFVWGTLGSVSCQVCQ